MSPEEIRAKRVEKTKQIMDLAKILKVNITAKQRVMPNGFLELMVIFEDMEDYPTPPVVAEGSGGVSKDA